jgi:CubicO group peptidase (beta-lactamase class C family)
MNAGQETQVNADVLIPAPAVQVQPDTRARLQQLVEDFRARMRLPGVSVSLLIDGEDLHASSGFGNLQMKTLLSDSSCFELGSIMNLLVGATVAQLASQGAIDLDASVSSYVPELAGSSADRISLRHLLTHTGGYQGENFSDPDIIAEYSWDEFAGSFRQRLQLFEPGTVFDYSPSGYVLVDRIVSNVTGKGVRELVGEVLLAPLGISAGGVAPGKHRVADHVFHPQMRRFVAIGPTGRAKFWDPAFAAPRLDLKTLAMVCSALVKSRAPLSEQARKLFLAPAVKLVGQFGRGEEVPLSFALGCGLFRNGYYGLGASMRGQCTAVRFDAEGRVVIAVGLAVNQPFLRDQLVNGIIVALQHSSKATPIRLLRDPSPAFDLAELHGSYEGAKHNLLLAKYDDRKLTIRRGHNPSASHASGNYTLVVEKRDDERLSLANDPPNVSIGFFNDPVSRGHCLMLGMRSYRKVS